MSENQKRILTMLSEGKISVEQAEQLLQALNQEGGGAAATPASQNHRPKYLIVNVHSAGKQADQPEKVKIRVPLQMLRAGIKLAAVIPSLAKDKINTALEEKGIHMDLDSIKVEDLEELIEAMADMVIDVNDENEKVQVYCE